VGRGASCTICQEKRRAHLKLVELKGKSLPFCHICAAQVIRLPEIPETLEELRHELRRERREADRRDGKVDQRIFPRERRVGERRGPSREAFADTDPRIRMGDVEDAIIELGDMALKGGDQTSVRLTPLPPPVASEPKPDKHDEIQTPSTD
jgi:hypothetical protein